MRLKVTAYSLLLILIIGCSQNNNNTTEQTDKVNRISVDTLYAFTNFDTHNIAEPTEIEVLDNGSIAVVDFGQRTVNLVHSNGELITSFGREGRGPGEFLRISNLFNTGDIIYVLDTDQSVVSKFDLEGNFLSGFTFKSPAILPEVALIDEDTYVAATGGIDNSILSITNLETDSTFNFGTPEGKSLEVVDLQASLNQLKNGEVPDLFKNMVTLRTNGEHIYTYLNAYSKLQKYDTEGNLVWDKKIELPYNKDIFNATVEKAKKSPGGLPAYNYINDFEIFDEEVVFLTNRKSSESPQQLVKLNNEGNITAIYTLPDAVGYIAAFDIAPESNTAYFASSQDGIVYKGSISL